MAVRDLAVPGRVRETLTDGALAPGWLAHGLLVVPFLLDVEVPLALQYAPLAVSVLVLGLPHGAVDHLAVPRVRDRPVTLRALAGVGALYGLLGGAYLALWFLAPVPAFLLFIAITWAHWGQGDIYALLALADVEHLRTRPQRVATAAVRGGLPMLVPLLSYPGQYRRVARALTGRFGVGPAELAPLFRVETRFALGAAFALLSLGTLAVGLARAERGLAERGWRLDAGETALLWVFFLAVPPILAVGVYFCLWHSLRHIARLVLLDEGSVSGLQGGDLGPALRGFTRDAAPLTAVSVAFLAAFYYLVPVRPANLAEGVGLYLVLIAVLTLPHFAVVSLMDRVQGVWTVSPSG
ncbi:Brp/Blh family beta-carotene 15,15'-dioxygenase [Haloglomus litoreum]|uniref:Brp/Blh family beta-carotene 15,15'-dioxygenase n=1 Tax=Haloglomus litoreum TaxID=3034026 RepID=UPI0023E83408|nr:Brp/Blh family beta-carotene 15,15'-dioxygenase [Haloglomus sp. DT116]